MANADISGGPMIEPVLLQEADRIYDRRSGFLCVQRFLLHPTSVERDFDFMFCDHARIVLDFNETCAYRPSNVRIILSYGRGNGSAGHHCGRFYRGADDRWL